MIYVAIDGSDAPLDDLLDWLRLVPELRGMVRLVGRTREGTMGGALELIVQATVGIAGAGALWATLGGAMTTWLTQRKSDVAVTFETADGRKTSVVVKRADNAEVALRSIQESLSSLMSVERD